MANRWLLTRRCKSISLSPAAKPLQGASQVVSRHSPSDAIPSTGNPGDSRHRKAVSARAFSWQQSGKIGSDRGSGSKRYVASGQLFPANTEKHSEASSEKVRGGKATHVSQPGSSSTLQHAHFCHHALARRGLGWLGPDFAME